MKRSLCGLILLFSHVIYSIEEFESTKPIKSIRYDHIHRPELLQQLGKHISALELVSVFQNFTSEEAERARKLKILCWINTYYKSHKSRLLSIKKTWGKKCDKIVFMSNIEDPEIPTIRINAPPTHEMLWQKHRHIVRLLYEEYGDKYDWIFKCDDDTFLIMENLRKYLISPEISSIPSTQPVLLGHRMTLQWWEMVRPFEPFEHMHPEHVKIVKAVKEATKAQHGLYYTPGGGGYAFNYAYLELLVKSLDEPYCLPNEMIPDDWAISFCLFYKDRVIPHDTRDEKKRERFHQYSPKRVFYEKHDPEAYNHKVFTSIYDENNWFSDHYGLGWQNGTNCCAPDSISFHYIKPPMMELIYEFFYGEYIPYQGKES